MGTATAVFLWLEKRKIGVGCIGGIMIMWILLGV
ncbi:spore morphogenesis/germination protein YwcE [Bacillus pumilus]